MPGCTGAYEVITDAGECTAAKEALVPTFSGVQEGGFGNEWANGCFYNSSGVYFHTVGDPNAHSGDQTTYTANGGWSDTHQALCKLRTAGAAQPSRSSSSSSAGNPACWSGAYTAARCCDASLGASGDRTCWSGQFNFVFCCAMVPGGH